MMVVDRTSAIVAANVRGLRAVACMNQQEIADRMKGMGHTTWSRATVSEIERGGRRVTVDEMVDLAVVFGVAPCDLLDEPHGFGHG